MMQVWKVCTKCRPINLISPNKTVYSTTSSFEQMFRLSASTSIDNNEPGRVSVHCHSSFVQIETNIPVDSRVQHWYSISHGNLFYIRVSHDASGNIINSASSTIKALLILAPSTTPPTKHPNTFFRILVTFVLYIVIISRILTLFIQDADLRQNSHWKDDHP
jgi:hypothetical protein